MCALRDLIFCFTGPQERQEHVEDVATHLKEALAECFEQKANISIAHVDIGEKLKEKGMEHVWDIEVVASHMPVCFVRI